MDQPTSAGRETVSVLRLLSTWRGKLVLLGILLAWSLIDVRQRGTVDPLQPGLHQTDFTVYTTAGAAAWQGLDPYQVTNIRGWGYLYLPLFALIVAPLHAIDPRWQVVIWFWISVLCAWGAWRELERLQRWRSLRSESIPSGLALLVILTALLPSLNCLQRGQVGLLQLYLSLLGIRWILSDRRWYCAAGGVILALAIVLKLVPILPTLVLLLGLLMSSLVPRSERLLQRGNLIVATGGVSLGLALGLLLIPGLCVGWERNWELLASWQQKVGSHTQTFDYDPYAGDSHSVRNQSPSNALWRLGNWIAYQTGNGPNDRIADSQRTQAKIPMVMDHPAAVAALSGLRWGLLALTGITILLLLCRPTRQTLLAAVGLANLATLIIPPIARGHYFMAVAPALLWLPSVLHQQTENWSSLSAIRRSAVAHPGRTAWLLMPLVLIWGHYCALGYAGRVGLLGCGMLLWFVITAGVIICRSSCRDQSSGGQSVEPSREELVLYRQAS